MSGRTDREFGSPATKLHQDGCRGGGEYRALVGFRRFLSRCHPTIFLSTHGRKIHDDCCRLLQQYKYKLIPLDGMDLQRSSNILAIDGT